MRAIALTRSLFGEEGVRRRMEAGMAALQKYEKIGAKSIWVSSSLLTEKELY